MKEYLHKILTKKVIIVVFSLILLNFLSPFVIVQAGHRGVVMNFGNVQEKVLDEGIHWRTPIIQKVQKIEVRSMKSEDVYSAYSKDTQSVDVLLGVNYHLDPEKVNVLYQEVGLDYETNILVPIINEELKTTIANYNAAELLANRPLLRDLILKGVKERVASRNIIIEDISIQNFDFSDIYETSIEAKQVAEQSALKAENDLKRVQFEAEQRIAQAKAEAEAIKIQAQAVTQQGGSDYVKLKWVEKWNGQLPQTQLSDATPLINLP